MVEALRRILVDRYEYLNYQITIKIIDLNPDESLSFLLRKGHLRSEVTLKIL